MQEVWKDVNIDGFKDFYQVSNLGRVKSKVKVVYKKNGLMGNLFPHKFPEKIRKLTRNKDGYLIVGLYLNQIEKKFRVHYLVAITFLYNENYHNLEINHKDCKKQNNCSENLEWVTHQENIEHANKNRLRGQKQILQIDKNNNIVRIWENLTEIKKELNFDKSSIVRVCMNKANRVYGFKWQYLQLNN